MRTATIFASYESIQRYLRISADAMGYPLDPSVTLTPIDAFFLRQFVECYPAKFAVIDMAAQATLGSSTIFWATLEQIGKLLVLEEENSQAQDHLAAWKELITEALDCESDQRAKLSFLPHGMNVLESASDLRKHIGPSQQLVMMIGVAATSSDDLLDQLSRLLSRHNNAIIILTPLAEVGTCRKLESALAVCHSESPFQFSLVREISPFCASSNLGLIYPKHNRHIPEILQRIQRFYEGNFDFLGLLEANVELQSKMQVCLARNEQLQSELLQAHEDLARLRRALANRTQELEDAYTSNKSKKKATASKATSEAPPSEETPPVGPALSENRAVMPWLKRGKK